MNWREKREAALRQNTLANASGNMRLVRSTYEEWIRCSIMELFDEIDALREEVNALRRVSQRSPWGEA